MWTFILTDAYGTTLGEVINASNRVVSTPHMRVPTATFTVPLDSERAGDLLTTSCLVKCVRDGVVVFNGPVVSVEETAQEGQQTITVNAAGPLWKLTKRIIPATKLQAGANFGDPVNNNSNLGQVAFDILNNVNAGSYTGIATGANSATTTGWVGRWWLKNAAEGLAELCSGLNTFEYRIRPVTATASASPFPTIGVMDIAPTIGQSQPDVVFEYGGGGRTNVASYTRSISRDTQINRAIVSVQGWPDGVEKTLDGAGNPTTTDKYSLVEVADTAVEAQYGTMDEVVNDGGVLDNGMRGQIATYHVNVRKYPRQQITFALSPNATPSPITNYNVGDVVRARATVGSTLRFDSLFRVWGLTFNIDDNGNENVDLELVSS